MAGVGGGGNFYLYGYTDKTVAKDFHRSAAISTRPEPISYT
jgi:hypothetical protein